MVLLFTNTGSSTCTLSGYPGATTTGSGQENWAVDPDGNAQRQTAVQGASPVTTVKLAPGSTASAQLFWDTYPMNSTYGDGTAPNAANCLAYRGGYLEITPPNTTTTTKIDPPLSMCQSLEISPVVSGTTGSSSCTMPARAHAITAGSACALRHEATGVARCPSDLRRR
jgi:hypothetical protein